MSRRPIDASQGPNAVSTFISSPSSPNLLSPPFPPIVRQTENSTSWLSPSLLRAGGDLTSQLDLFSNSNSTLSNSDSDLLLSLFVSALSLVIYLSIETCPLMCSGTVRLVFFLAFFFFSILVFFFFYFVISSSLSLGEEEQEMSIFLFLLF